MKKYFFVFILILISCTVFASEKTNLSDSEISKLLIGKWRIMLSDKKTASGQKLNIEMEATWKVESGKLVSSLVSIKPKGLMPIGLTNTDTVISINKVKFIFRDGNTGELQTYYRVGK